MKRRTFLIPAIVTTAFDLPARSSQASKAFVASKRNYDEELVQAHTEDDIEQTGLLVVPSTSPRHSVGVVGIHGATANFYYPSYVSIARATASLGHAFLLGNTRMHDIGCVLADRPDGKTVRGGSYWGLPSKEPLDIAAWISLAQSHGLSSVALVGHSAGGPAVIWPNVLIAG